MVMNQQAAPAPQTALDQFFETYPHLASIVSDWGTQAARERIAGLVLDTRDGARKGFPADHAATLLRLLMEHDAQFPQFEPKIRFDWSGVVMDAQVDRIARKR